MGRVVDIVAGLVAVGAGLYLLQFSSPGASSWFEVIGHGMGAYFIARGIFGARSGLLQARMADDLEDLTNATRRDLANRSD